MPRSLIIVKGEKFFNLYQHEDAGRRHTFLSTEEGEGMGLDEELFYEHIKKFFEEHM